MKKLLIIAAFCLLPLSAQAAGSDAAAPASVPIPAADASVSVSEGDIVVAEPEKPAEAPVPAATRQWEMVPEDSSIKFSGKQMGADFEGAITSFTTQIFFDPDNLPQSKVIAEIDLRSIDAKDTDRNKNLPGKDWFDIGAFPTARFETQDIKKTGDNAYVADATLTIHGIIQEIALPFTLDITRVEKGEDKGKDKAVMHGDVTLDRSKFQLGTGDWADPSVIANEVPVTVTVTALSPAQN